MATKTTATVDVRTDDDGVTYFLEHDGQRARVRFLTDGRVRFVLGGRWTMESAFMTGKGEETEALILMLPKP